MGTAAHAGYAAQHPAAVAGRRQAGRPRGVHGLSQCSGRGWWRQRAVVADAVSATHLEIVELFWLLGDKPPAKPPARPISNATYGTVVLLITLVTLKVTLCWRPNCLSRI